MSVTFQTCSSSPSLALFFAFIRFIWRHECRNGKNVSTYILFVWQCKNHKKWWDWDTHRAWQLFRRKEKKRRNEFVMKNVHWVRFATQLHINFPSIGTFDVRFQCHKVVKYSISEFCLLQKITFNDKKNNQQ